MWRFRKGSYPTSALVGRAPDGALLVLRRSTYSGLHLGGVQRREAFL